MKPPRANNAFIPRYRRKKRQPPDVTNTQQVMFKATKRGHLKIKHEAEQAGLSMGEYIRRKLGISVIQDPDNYGDLDD